LWLVVKATHQILTTSKVATIIKKTAREEYAACKQGPFEHIVDYKRKFNTRLDALIVSGNMAPSKEDVAMDFMYGLDNARYAEFKAEIVNDLQKGTLTQIKDLNKMYILASRSMVVKVEGNLSGGATFATVDTRITKKQPNDNKKEKTKEQKQAERLAKMKCFNCGEKGHPAKSCPKKDKRNDDEEEEPPMAGMTTACCVTAEKKHLHNFYEVCLDNGRQVNIVDSRLLTNLRTARRMYRYRLHWTSGWVF
jgi:hypothetical protein